MNCCSQTSRLGQLCRWVLGVAIVQLVVSSHQALGQEASGKLAEALGAMALDIKSYMTNDAKETSIAVGSFSGQPQLASSAGAAIKKTLIDKLQENGITVSRRARLALKGEYFFESGDPSVLLTARILEGNRRRKSYERKIYDVEDILSLTGASGDLSVDDPAKRKADVLKAVENQEKVLETKEEVVKEQQAAISNTPDGNKPAGNKIVADPASGDAPPTSNIRVKSSPNSPYGVEIYVKRGGGYEPTPLEDDEGLSFADLQLEDVYAIKLINKSKRPAAVTLTIDGLNLFEFSDVPHYRQLGKVIIPASPKGSLVRGWHVTNDFSDEFLVVEYGKSEKVKLKDAEGQLQHDEEVGTITASFSVAYLPSENVAEFEGLAGARGVQGTARGARVDQKYTEGFFQFGNVRTVLSVRYNRELPPL